MLSHSGLLLASLGTAQQGVDAETAARKMRVVVVGAHPDDPESGCGGTIARYTGEGHAVTVLYLTRGESGIRNMAMDKAAAIRTAESEKACAILKARPVFAGQIDGHTEINAARYEELRAMLDAEKPDIVFTHWPVDAHRDHRAASMLAYDAWLATDRSFDLYYFEVEQGRQTQIFHPTDYVDIATTVDMKKAACFAHASQHPDTDFWPLHDAMQRFRGGVWRGAGGGVRSALRESRDRDAVERVCYVSAG